jgi:hypothetical protein
MNQIYVYFKSILESIQKLYFEMKKLMQNFVQQLIVKKNILIHKIHNVFVICYELLIII